MKMASDLGKVSFLESRNLGKKLDLEGRDFSFGTRIQFPRLSRI